MGEMMEGQLELEEELLEAELEGAGEIGEGEGILGEIANPTAVGSKQWILDTSRSAIELIANAALRNRFLQEISWSREYFPGNRDESTGQRAEGRLASNLFDAIAHVVPERRVPFSLRYRPDIANIVVPIPGVLKNDKCSPAYKKVHPEASEAFVRMREAAAKDGIPIRPLPGCRTAWRTAADQAAVRRHQDNRLAAAGRIGAHMYGLAVDLQLGVRGLPISEANTRTPEKMANIVRMYRSPIYKWLALSGRRFGWFPYRREPWHWEYNPPGFKDRYETGAGKSREIEFESALMLEEELEGEAAELELLLAAGNWLKPFTSRAIPNYPDRRQTGCSVYVPKAAWGQTVIDLLVFFHGLDRCRPTFIPDPKKTLNKFGLDGQIDASGRKVALAVPVIHWDANVSGIWTAANLNRFVDEVRSEIGRQSGVTPTLGRLIIAGHSKAYAILTPLTQEFANNAPATRKEALAKLTEVWALDSTYGEGTVRALYSWARAVPNGRFIAVLNKISERGRPIYYWNAYKTKSTIPPPNLKMCKVEEMHCVIPTRYIRQLLSAKNYPPDWCRF